MIEITKYVQVPGAASKGKILMVCSSPVVSSQTGWPIGFWLAELTHPMRVFQEAGYEVELASTDGGKVVPDAYSYPTHESGYSASDVISLGYLQLDSFNQMLENTKKFTDCKVEDYEAICLVGGLGPMYTFRGNETLGNLFSSFYENNKPAIAVCHGSALLLDAKKGDGELLVKGKTWTGFSNGEEDKVESAFGMVVQPFRIESEAAKISNTTFKTVPPYQCYVVADGYLVTAQQQNSGSEAAELVVKMLNK